MSTVTKSITSDFGGNLNITQLHSLIVADAGITKTLQEIDTDDDVVDIVFDQALSGSDTTALNDLIGGYTYAANPRVDIDTTGSFGTVATVTVGQTANRTLTLPDADDTVTCETTTQTITNKILPTSNNVALPITEVSNVTTVSTTSTAYVDVGRSTITVSNGGTADYLVQFSADAYVGQWGAIGEYILNIDGSDVAYTKRTVALGLPYITSTFTQCKATSVPDGAIVKVRFKVSVNTLYFLHRSLTVTQV